MDVNEAIRKRRAVRTYTDAAVSDEVLDRLLRLSLAAPTGAGAQAWGMIVVREEAQRAALADLIIDGGGRYFSALRYRKDDVSEEEHAQWGADYAEKILGTYRQVPVWIVGALVPRGNYPEEMKADGRDDDLISLAFAMENLFLSARAEGLGTVPTTAFQRFEKDRLREILGMPAEVNPEIITPLGYPETFPEGLPPAMKKSFRPWKTLVHDETWGAVRESNQD